MARSQRATAAIDFRIGHPQPVGIEVQPVEALREGDERRITVATHLGEDGADRGIHVLRYFALGGKQCVKAASKSGWVVERLSGMGCLSGRARMRKNRSGRRIQVSAPSGCRGWLSASRRRRDR